MVCKDIYYYTHCCLTDTSQCQGPTISGKINLTCGAWQANNTDGYFAVTGHWIEEKVDKKWMLESGLLGFVQMNTSHNGV